jgi:predicted enzyme related to lactoylglutathione lyase
MKLDSAVFYTNDLGKIISFYRDTIGLEVEYIQEERFVSFIFPDGGKLGIKQRKEEREIPGHQTVFVSVENIEDLFREYKEKGLSFRKKLSELEGWGKYFSILDPDKNNIEFIEHEKK